MLLLSIALSSCFKDGLNEDTRGILGSETFYKTESDFQAALIPAYRYFSNAFFNAQGQQTMFGGDDLTTRAGSNKEDFREWDLFDYNSGSGWIEQFAWQPYWQTIYAANAIINNVDHANADVDAEVLKQIEGQAHFLRGLSYFMLVREFGGMPLLTEAVATGDEKRASVLENYQLIESDMQFAIANLPASWSPKGGRATSGAAHTVLASLYLTWAGWPVKDASKYALAAKEAQTVMESGEYGLVDHYIDLWTLDNELNEEVVFTIVWNLEANTFVNNMSQGYAPIEEQGWVDGQAELTLFNRMPPGPRKEATYLTEFVNDLGNGETIDWQDSQLKHPTFKKWVIGGTPRGAVPHYNGEHNVPLFRYAEVLLTFAEADAMANGGPGAADYDAINAVRQRAGLPDLTPGLGKQAFQDSVVEERAFEFAGEYTRWFDEVRTESVAKYSGAMRDPDEIPLRNQPSEQYYISPIPAAELIKDPNLVQNPEGNVIK